MAKVAAIVTSYNRADFVGKCVKSIVDSVNGALDVHVLLMDNGSGDGSPEIAKEAGGDKVTVFHTEDNRPLVGVLNKGIAEALSDPSVDYVLILNEDTLWPEGALNLLVSVAEKHPNALLSPLQLNYRNPDTIDNLAFEHIQGSRQLLEDAVLGKPLQEAYPVPTIIGAGMLGHRSVWENLGLWDPMFPFYGPDDDYCNRARFLGYEILVVPRSHLLHAHERFDKTPRTRPEPGAVARRWKSELMASNLFILKDPGHALWLNYLRGAGFTLRIALRCLLRGQASGLWQTLAAYFRCVVKAPQIAATRREQFDTGKRVTT